MRYGNLSFHDQSSLCMSCFISLQFTLHYNMHNKQNDIDYLFKDTGMADHERIHQGLEERMLEKLVRKAWMGMYITFVNP